MKETLKIKTNFSAFNFMTELKQVGEVLLLCFNGLRLAFQRWGWTNGDLHSPRPSSASRPTRHVC